MGTPADQLAAELRAFDGRRALVQAMRRGLSKAVPAVRERIRRNALETLPAGNGLARWTAAARITNTIKYAGRAAGISLKGSRKSQRDKSDLFRMDAAGRVRAPSWGRRTPGNWHTQSVTPGWFTLPASQDEGFRARVDEEVDRALDTIRRG